MTNILTIKYITKTLYLTAKHTN